MKWQSRLLVVLATAVCAVYAQTGGRWLWPDEVVSARRNEQSIRTGSGRHIQGRPGFDFNPGWPNKDPVQFVSFTFPQKSQPLPVSGPQRPVHQPLQPVGPTAVPFSAPAPAAVSSTPPPSSGLPSTSTTPTAEDDSEPPSTVKKNSSVPLLADAGKPGNPYELLNRIFPPEQRIRTKEEEEANLNSLANEDLGGLDPREVYLADSDLFVIRGFNFKKPYNPDPPGPPISDYEAPAPNPPPPPEPGTVFYPISNDTDELPGLPLPNFNETDFSPFFPAGLGNSSGKIPFLPFPFLPPPAPHHDSTKEPQDPFGEFPFPPFGEQGQRPPGLFPPGPPGSAPPGSFPPGPPGSFPPPGSQGPVPPPPSGLPPLGPFNLSNIPEFIFPGNFSEDDDSVPFTPLFPERPVEYYYPTHNTTATPPGPFGPGIFVPPPKGFFAPRNESEELSIRIPSALFKPPFNLPNYYEKPQINKGLNKFTRPFAINQPALNQQPARPQNSHPFLNNNIPFVQHVRVVPHHGPATRAPPTVRPLYAGNPVTFGRPPSSPISAPSVPKPINLGSDINVNYKFPRPEINPDSELVDVSLLQPPPSQPAAAAPNRPTPLQLGHNKPLKYSHSQRLPGANLQLQPSREAYVSVYRRDGAGSYSYTLSRRR